MAEIIKDTYSLEFDSQGFESQIAEAIARVEELQGAMEETAGSTEELDGALAALEDVLKKDAKGVEDLNQKQKVLATTQKGLNKESAAYGAVSKENTKTQKQLAQATADTTKNQKSLGGSVLDGARKLNSLKRAAGIVSGAFRLLGALNPLAFALSALPTVIGFFQGLVGSTNKAQAALEKLNDPNLSLQERSSILKEEIDRLNELEARAGSLSEEEQKSRDELTAKYKETSEEILRIESERIQRITDLQNEAARIRVKLLGDSTAGIIENFKVESQILGQESIKEQTKIFQEINKLAAQAEKLRADGKFEEARKVQDAIDLLQAESDAFQERLALQRQQLAKQRNDELLRLQQEAIKKRQDAEKKAAEEEAADQERRAKEVEDEINAQIEAADKERERLAKEAAERQAAFEREVSIELNNQKLNDFVGFLDERSALESRASEIDLARAVLQVETERNARLLQATQNISDKEQLAKELEKIDKEYTKRRQTLENNASIQIAQKRIEVLKAAVRALQASGLDTSVSEKEIADLELKIKEIEKQEISVDADTEPAENKLKELAKKLLPLFQNVSDEIFGLLSQQASFLTERLDKAVENSKTSLDEIRANSEDFNAEQLALEKRRLNDLEAARRQAARREQTIAQIQIVANAALAIAKAAAEGGVAAPFTIASTIISLIAGFAAARNAASGAFFTGTEYLERNGAPKGKDTIHIRAHEGERIVPTANNLKYWDAYSAFQNEKIPAEIANLFAKGYLSGGLPGAVGALGGHKLEPVNLRKALGEKVVYIMPGHNQDSDKLEKVMQEVSEQLAELPKKMPISTFNVNSHGLYMSTKRYIGRQEMRKNRAK